MQRGCVQRACVHGERYVSVSFRSAMISEMPGALSTVKPSELLPVLNKGWSHSSILWTSGKFGIGGTWMGVYCTPCTWM